MALVGRIGPDVLRTDANPDLAYNKIARSRAPIGRLIMDQSVMAGIGNIYRSEILWRQAIHPETPGKAIGRQNFDQIWNDARTLLAIGVERNAIVTVFDGQSAKREHGEKYNIFGKTNCPNCKGGIRRFEISGRRTFVCETCQPIETQ
jgi:endonuclease-8